MTKISIQQGQFQAILREVIVAKKKNIIISNLLGLPREKIGVIETENKELEAGVIDHTMLQLHLEEHLTGAMQGADQ